MISDLLDKKSMTKYRLSKLTGIPYTTINDICSERADIKKCSVDTVYKIASVLNVTMEELLKPYYEERPGFELFKSGVCQRLKEMGDVDFLIDALGSNIVCTFYEKRWYPESLYMLAMIDYLSKENGIPICSEYDELRKCKLSKTIFPASVLARCAAEKSDNPKKQAMKQAIPEFLNYNIVESEVRDVV